MLKRISIVLSVIALLLVVGCSKPPEMEMQNADSSMQAARAAEAESYSPQSYRAAMDALNAATAAKEEQDGKFALFRSYGKVKEMYVQAQALADKAVTDAQTEKERVKGEVTAMMTEVQTALDDAAKAIDKAPKGKGSKADIEMFKADLATAQAGFADAKTQFDAGKFLTAKASLEAVKAKAGQIVADIAAAKAKKMGN
jgi:hypothetical protein